MKQYIYKHEETEENPGNWDSIYDIVFFTKNIVQEL